MERANSEDPFTVAATTGELIVDCKKVLLFAECFYNNFEIGQFSVDLLDLLLKDWCGQLPQLVISKNFGRGRHFSGNKLLQQHIFVELLFNCKNHENFCLAKLSTIRYSRAVFFSAQSFHTVWLLIQ